LWLILPLTLGDLLAAALDDRSAAVAVTGTISAWVVWTAGLIAALITLPRTLTLLRVLAPLPVLAGIVAAVDTSADASASALAWVGLAAAALVAVTALTADLGDDFVNGSSYGDERRLALRPPAVLLLGPLQLVWVLTVAPVVAALALIGSEQWVAGAACGVAGAGTAWWGSRRMHRLACRWLVFVPAGVTLVDEVVLAEPTLFRRDAITRFGPAPADTSAVDLSAGASGLILQIDLDVATSLLPTPGRDGVSTPVEARSVLIAPTRPGAALTHAETRRILVQRA